MAELEVSVLEGEDVLADGGELGVEFLALVVLAADLQLVRAHCLMLHLFLSHLLLLNIAISPHHRIHPIILIRQFIYIYLSYTQLYSLPYILQPIYYYLSSIQSTIINQLKIKIKNINKLLLRCVLYKWTNINCYQIHPTNNTFYY